MKFPYWKLAPENPQEPWTRRPIIRVTLEGPKRSLTLEALVDSGADHSLFHTEVAEALGVDLAACTQRMVTGIELTPAKSYLTELPLTAENLDRVSVPVMFWDKQPIALIGQVGFFDLHRIKFERDHETFEITPAKKR